MCKFLDLKAIGYGLATFVAGHLLVSLIGQAILGPVVTKLFAAKLSSESYAIVGILGDILLISPAVIAGFVSAYKADSHRIINGSIGGVLIVVLLMGFFSSFINTFLGWGPAFLILSAHVVAALIGATMANYWCGKRDKKAHNHVDTYSSDRF